jgi:UDP-N-acetylglucosamine diphosphorylase/glucosamine-1-phosphate N-acetyltransferase
MAIILFDPNDRDRLLPLASTRAFADIRLGILTQRERWEQRTKEKVGVATAAYLRCLYEPLPEGDQIWVDASAYPDTTTMNTVCNLAPGAALRSEGSIWACRINADQDSIHTLLQEENNFQVTEHTVSRLMHPWDLINKNRQQLVEDFEIVQAGKLSEPIPAHVHCTHPEKIFIEPGAELAPCYLNATEGPIYIGRNANILEGAAIRGPFAMCDGAVVKMQSSIYGATTLGPYCVGGGEIKNTLMMGYSNKAHHGYLGDAVIGEWCNLGAGATNSNVKNTAGIVSVWDFHTQQYIPVGQKCGVIMGDYCTVSIQAAMNTGSIYGVCCNIYGNGLLPTVVEPCSWGVTGTRYQLPKAIASISNWKQMRGRRFTAEEISILEYIFAQL